MHPSTGLPIDRAALSDTDAGPIGVVVANICELHLVNVIYGQLIGDRVLTTTALRIADACPAGARVLHTGGAEMTIILSGFDLVRTEQVASAIGDALLAPAFTVRAAISDRHLRRRLYVTPDRSALFVGTPHPRVRTDRLRDDAEPPLEAALLVWADVGVAASDAPLVSIADLHEEAYAACRLAKSERRHAPLPG
jgi:GGDEF domain-containing protein